MKVFANASAAAPPAVYFAKTFTDYPTLEIYDEAMTAVLGGGKLSDSAGQVNIESNRFFTIYQVWLQAAESGRLGRALDHYPSMRGSQRQLEA